MTAESGLETSWAGGSSSLSEVITTAVWEKQTDWKCALEVERSGQLAAEYHLRERAVIPLMEMEKDRKQNRLG